MERKRFEDLTPDEVRGFVERVIADEGPKPLSEWTTEETEELRKCIYSGHYDRENMLIELLRRTRAEERERCAKLCEARAVDLITQPADHGRSVATRELWAVAKDIRGLQ